ncbi:efflux RND transporter permease subunit [Botrimarina sp.]|uniref:efflux RND transporter permease subunit n=1 Tax=Botrimarina sp. TaxID=2795802 RepID=UPI0032EC1AB9
MKISNAAIERPRLVLIGTALTLLVALFAAISTPVQLGPAITKAVVLVAIPYPDAKPTETENEIIRKVEDALTDLEAVDFIASTSMRGSGVTQVVFLDGVTPAEARREVKDLVDRIRNELPAGREVQPFITDVDFENLPLMLLNIRAPEGFDERALKQIAEDVQDQIETVAGVSNTQLFGGKEREIQVNIDPDLAAEYGVTLAELRQALAAFHAELPAGSFETRDFNRSVRNETKLRNVDDIAEAVVRSEGGRVIRVKDVAEVVDGYRRVLNAAEFDGQPGATLIVNKESGINTLGAARSVKAMVANLREQYPGFRFDTTRDSSAEIWVMFRVLGSSAIFGAALVLVILAWTMGLRIATLVIMAIPCSMAVALAFLYATGVPVSNMVVFSFILVLGMVVDGAIIVAENIHRHIERGEDPVDAAKIGIEEVGVPVIAADLTTIAAFLPMLLVPGIMGDFMGVMPKVVTAALAGSILVDHFLIPTLAARWYRRREVPPELAGRSGAEAMRVRPKLDPFTRAYAAMLRFCLHHRALVLVWVVLAVLGTRTLVGYLGFNFFPTSDRGQFIVKYELPLGYSIDQTLAAADVITEPLERWRETGALQHYVTSVGSSGALAMRVDEDAAAGPEFGQVQVQMLPPMDRNVSQTEVINYLRENIKPLPGMKFSVEEIEDGPPGGAKVSVRLTGKNLEQLGEVAERVAARLKNISGTVDVSTDYRPDTPELVIEPKSDVIGLFGMTDAQVAEAVQIAIAGDNRIQVTLDDEDVDLRIQLAPEHQRTPAELGRLMLTGAGGQKTTIRTVADLRRETGLFSINRYDRNRAVVAKCDVDESTSAADVFEVLAKEVLPELGFRPAEGAEKTIEGFSKAYFGEPATLAEGLQAEFTGENDERDKNFGYLLRSMVIAVVLIAAILAIQFNSFRQSLIVMAAVPLSFIGVGLGMWACGFPFSLATFIGLVSLTGIVVNDAIVLVDFANQARARGAGVQHAIMEAGINRLRPVMLTTLTTCGGLLPLLLNVSGGAEFWQPLTGAVVFGLAFATLLTLVVIPCCYSLAYVRPRLSEVVTFAAFTALLFVVLPAIESGVVAAARSLGWA